MNPTFSRFWRNLIVLAIFGGFSFAFLPPVRGSYDSPNFDARPFDTDALSLNDRAVEEIVAALTALALNFPSKSEVDDDLREKAIGIALSLDPIDNAARSAHESLLRGESGKPVEFFSTLSSLSTALWRHCEKLAAPDAEPEDHKLAPYLMEIALLTGKPEPDQLRFFGQVTELKPVNWSSLVRLQGSAYESNRRAQILLREAEKFASSPSGMKPTQPGIRNKPPGGNTAPGPKAGVAEIKNPKVIIRHITFDDDLGAIPGEARLNVREPRPDESSLFGLFLSTEKGSGDSFMMRLGWDRDGPTISGYEAAGDLVKATYPKWPTNLIAEFTFAAAGGKKPSQIDLSFPCVLLLESAFSGNAIAPDVAITGNMTASQEIELPASAADLARAAGIGGGTVVKVLLMPASGESGLTDAVTAGDLSVLVRPQIIAFNSFEEAKSLAYGPRPEALAEAVQKFGEIQNLNTQGMQLDELSKNPAVQDRLRAIGKLWPGHLSAKIMLAHGTQPVAMHMSPAGSVGQIDAVLKPVTKHYTDSVFGGGTVVGAAEKLVDQARVSLRELREKVHPDARACLSSAERAIESFDDYFSLTNKSSSRAAQLRRELQEAINALNTQRSQLGASDNLSL